MLPTDYLKGITLMIDLFTEFFQPYIDLFITWYNAAGNLTQYSVLMFLGMALFLISVIRILSRITR